MTLYGAGYIHGYNLIIPADETSTLSCAHDRRKAEEKFRRNQGRGKSWQAVDT